MAKTNNSLFAFTFAFLVLLSVGFSSAAITLSTTTDLPSLVNDSSSYNLVLNATNTGNETINISWAKTISPSAVGVSIPANTLLEANHSALVTFTYSIPSGLTGAITSTIFATANSSETANKTVSTTAQITPSTTTDFCDFGNQGTNISITDFSINNKGNGDDTEWYFLDNVEIDVEITNNRNKKISNVIAEIAVYSGSTDVTDDFNFEDTKLTVGSISDDDSKTVTFVLLDVPADINDGDYTLKVKAYVKSDENIICKQDSEAIQVTNPFGEGVIVSGDIISDVTNANAGDSIEVSLDALNLGSDKEEEILVTLYNKELGINEKYNINDLKSGKSETITFPLIAIPSTAQTKTYKVDVRTYFNYDKGDVLDVNSYDSNSYDDLEDDYNTFAFNIKVTGTSTSTSTKPTITAKLNSTAKVGQDLVIEVTIKNNGNQSTSFFLSADSYDSWATLAGISQVSLILNKQESRTVLITFKPTEAGQQTFNIQAVYDGKTTSQQVTVNISEQEQNFFSKAIASYGALTVWLITAIVALILLILIVFLIRIIFYSSRR